MTSPFFGVFGNLSAVLQADVAQVIQFPRRGTSDIAKLRVEIEQMRRIVLGTGRAGKSARLLGI